MYHLSIFRTLIVAVAFFGLGGLTAPSAEAGDVHLVWDANTEPDLAGYIVLMGTASRVYTQSFEVGPGTLTKSITGLQDGKTYYFAVRAANLAGLLSGLSNEVSITLGGGTTPVSSPVVTAVTPDLGPTGGGTLVRLAVSNLKAGATVTFDGLAADIVHASATSLSVIAPAHPADGEVAVIVRNPDGGTSNAAAFTYEAGDGVASLPFVRYFAEGAQSAFFATRFALANPHPHAVTARVTLTDVFGQKTVVSREIAGESRITLDRTNLPTLASEAFGATFEASHAVGIDRTMTWDATSGYGAHSETGIAAPGTTWYLAEGATHSGFNLFYLLQNSTDTTAEVRVRYLLATGAVIEKQHLVAPRARTNIWVNKDDPALASAEMSAHLVSTNGVPIVVERSMYLDRGGQLFTAGHNSAAQPEARSRWFLAEGATGDYFDTFVLIANPNPTAALLRVTYLRAGDTPVEARYTVAANSRLTIWVDKEPGLARADVSTIVESTNGQPVIVERSMWWPGTPGGPWTEAHNSAGATTTAARWVLADGVASASESTYVLVANTGTAAAPVTFTVLGVNGRGERTTITVGPQQRFSVDVGGTFSSARGTTFGVLVEAPAGTPLVVERATYADADNQRWAAGSNSLATPLTP